MKYSQNYVIFQTICGSFTSYMILQQIMRFFKQVLKIRYVIISTSYVILQRVMLLSDKFRYCSTNMRLFNIFFKNYVKLQVMDSKNHVILQGYLWSITSMRYRMGGKSSTTLQAAIIKTVFFRCIMRRMALENNVMTDK